jgi:hypothetical protein
LVGFFAVGFLASGNVILITDKPVCIVCFEDSLVVFVSSDVVDDEREQIERCGTEKENMTQNNFLINLNALTGIIKRRLKRLT